MKLACLVGVLCLMACGSDPGATRREGEVCPPGTEHCACYGNGTCNAGLMCVMPSCVAIDTLGDAGLGSPMMDAEIAIDDAGAQDATSLAPDSGILTDAATPVNPELFAGTWDAALSCPSIPDIAMTWMITRNVDGTFAWDNGAGGSATLSFNGSTALTGTSAAGSELVLTLTDPNTIHTTVHAPNSDCTAVAVRGLAPGP